MDLLSPGEKKICEPKSLDCELQVNCPATMLSTPAK